MRLHVRIEMQEEWDFNIVHKKNKIRHSHGEPHTNHIINNTKTNNCVREFLMYSCLTRCKGISFFDICNAPDTAFRRTEEFA